MLQMINSAFDNYFKSNLYQKTGFFLKVKGYTTSVKVHTESADC